MGRANLNQTSFTGGVLSPRALGRVDVDRYFQALKSAVNGYAVPQGGFVRRPGTLYVGECYVHTYDASILVPFVVGRDQAYMLEFTENRIRFFNADGTVAGSDIINTGYASAYMRDLDFAQEERTMWIFSPGRPVSRLQLLGSGTWVLDVAPFTTAPFAEVGWYSTPSTVISDATVGSGRTLSSTPMAMFLASDVGRAVTYEGGIAVITAVASATSATVEVTRAFPTVNLIGLTTTLEGSPQTTCTPSAKDPVGATITLTAGAAAWRSRDVGAFVRINGGLCKITVITSSTVADAVIVRELSGTVAAPALSWTLEHSVWTQDFGYPRTGTIYQQRLIVGGNNKFPRTVWGSRLGEPLDFELGTTDDLAFSFTISSDEASAISYVTSSPDLLVLTESGEYSMRGGVEKPITPTNVRVKQETAHGSAAVRPVFAGGECVFVQRAGRKVRSLTYRYDFDRYAAPDLTSLSEHLTKAGVIWMAWQQEPDPLLWVGLSNGTFLSCALDRDQQPSVVGWFPHSTDGFVEWGATMPAGDRDVLWIIVRRGFYRYIERFDATFEALHQDDLPPGADIPVYGMTVDCGVTVSDAAGVTTIDLPHLVGKTVDIVADGLVMAPQEVPPGGTVTLPRSAKQIQAGLHFETRAELLTPEMGTQAGTAQGTAHRTGKVFARFLDTIGAKLVNDEGGAQQIPFQQFGDSLLDQSPQPFTGFVEVSVLGWQKGRSELTIVQDLPLPMHLLSITRRHTANEG